MPSLRRILMEIGKELKDNEEVREAFHLDMRKVTSLSKRSILLIHQKRIEEARKLLKQAERIIGEIGKVSDVHPEIISNGFLSAAQQEYSEANIFLKLVDKSEFVSPKEIKVSSVDYVLGLADVIGECRRLSLDALREGNVDLGEKCLQTMDEIYIELTAMNESYMLVPGLRRKCDVARKIIEITRGDITQEIRRSRLEKSLERLEKKIKMK